MVGNYDGETNFPNKLLLTDRQVVNHRKAFADYLSTDIKSSKTQFSKIMQAGGFSGRLLGSLLKIELALMKNVIKQLAKGVLIPLGLTSAASVADAGIHKKILGSGNTTLMISNDEMEGIIKIVKSHEISGLLLKRVGETIQNEAKEQKKDFLVVSYYVHKVQVY